MKKTRALRAAETDKVTQALTIITQVMLNVGVAVPIVFAAIAGIAAIIKGLVGHSLTVGEIADLMALQNVDNDVKLAQEIRRLKALLGLA